MKISILLIVLVSVTLLDAQAVNYETWYNLRNEIVVVFNDSVEKLIERGYLVKPLDEKIHTYKEWSIVNDQIMLHDKPFGIESFIKAKIILDKQKYFTDDIVKIVILSPTHNLNDNLIEEIDSDMEEISIETRNNKSLTKFNFIETKPDSGIFKGEFRLVDYRNPDIDMYDEDIVLETEYIDAFVVSLKIGDDYPVLGAGLISGHLNYP